jgi:hypothetical protein
MRKPTLHARLSSQMVIHAAKSCPLFATSQKRDRMWKIFRVHNLIVLPGCFAVWILLQITAKLSEICLTSIPRTAAISVLQNVHAKLLQF